MKVKDTKGKSHSWNLTGYTVAETDTRPRSELHVKIRTILKELFPNDQILEEVSMPGENLYCDFYLPLRKKLIEAHGEQHFKYIKHFHGDIKGFLDSKERDTRKQQWCLINNIQYIPLKYNEESLWKQQILN